MFSGAHSIFKLLHWHGQIHKVQRAANDRFDNDPVNFILASRSSQANLFIFFCLLILKVVDLFLMEASVKLVFNGGFCQAPG